MFRYFFFIVIIVIVILFNFTGLIIVPNRPIKSTNGVNLFFRTQMSWHDLLLSEVELVDFKKVSDNAKCAYDIPCPNIIAIERIRDGHVTYTGGTGDGLVYDGAGGIHSYGYWWWKNKQIVPKKGQRIKKALSFVRVFEHNFQHVAIASFLKIRYYCDWISQQSDMMILVMNSVQQRVLQYGCPAIDASRFMLRSPPELAVDELFVVHFTAFPDKPQSTVLTLAASPKGIMKLPKVTTDTMFYMERKKEKLNKRYVLNNAAVVSTLRQVARELGIRFEIFNGDVERLSRAAYMVGPHGGAMGNLIYTSASTVIVEFITLKGLRERPCYVLSAETLSLEYKYLEPDVFDFDTGGMQINVSKLRSLFI